MPHQPIHSPSPTLPRTLRVQGRGFQLLPPLVSPWSLRKQREPGGDAPCGCGGRLGWGCGVNAGGVVNGILRIAISLIGSGSSGLGCATISPPNKNNVFMVCAATAHQPYPDTGCDGGRCRESRCGHARRRKPNRERCLSKNRSLCFVVSS